MCPDTDVFLFMYAYEKHKLSCTLLMEDPVAGKKQDVWLHVLSGCGVLSQLYEIGKGKVVTIQNDVYLNKLGYIHESFSNVHNECEQLMLACYGAQKSASMSAAWYDLWLSKLSKKTASAALLHSPLKSLPPTSEAFREHVKRAHLIAAQILHPPNLSLVEQGWTYDDLSKCFDPVTYPSGVEPAPVEVPPLLIPCGCSLAKPCRRTICSCYSEHV